MKTPTGQHLKSYLETISGISPELHPLDVPQLPLFLRHRYSFFSVELFGRTWGLALENESCDTGSAGEYEKQAQTLLPRLKSPVVFVLPALPSNTRNRMVQKGIPFIVPGNQAFLPGALVDLREHFPKPSGKGRSSLSPTAQLTLLYHLEREPLSGLPLKSIAEKLHCSAMMLSKVKDELEDTGICEVERIGRSMALKFPAKKRALWDLAQSRLTSPVKKTRWVRWMREPGYPALLSGISALSRRTMLAADRLPTYALGPGTLEEWLEGGTMSGCPDAEQANAKIEVWSYEPKLLGDNEIVDPLSLYLSLRHDADERVQQQLERLMEANIKKHRADVFRLAATLPGVAGPDLPQSIKDDLVSFLQEFPPDSADWSAILASLSNSIPGTFRPADLREAIQTYFGIVR